MNKQEMIKAMSADNGLTQVDNSKMLASLEKLTIETIEAGERVQLTGFVTFKPVFRAARKGFDPIKEVPMDIPATVGLKVSAGERLKRATAELEVADFEVVED